MLNRVSIEALLYAGIVLSVFGTVIAATLAAADEEGIVRRRYKKYIAEIDAEHKFLFVRTPGATIARNQMLGIAALSAAGLFFEQPLAVLAILAVAVLPLASLRRKHAKRVEALETQLDGWLLILANALKATPALGEAVRASTKIMRAPIQQELDYLLKEVNLGTPLDEGLRSMGARINSRIFSSAIATILVGRQTGGDIPRILEESAATLREMQRLEGVVRSKTAEGKSQAYVLGVIPFLLIGAIQFIDPTWMIPLTESVLGYAIIGISTTLWVAAILLARKILAVDV